MDEYLCFLVSVLYNGGLLKCAMKIHSDCLKGDAVEYYNEPENKKQFHDMLPLHVRNCGEIVEIVEIFECCEINPPQLKCDHSGTGICDPKNKLDNKCLICHDIKDREKSK